MTHAAAPELMNQLSEIAQRSAMGEIPWTQPSPSMFMWIKESEASGAFQVTIQKASKPRPNNAAGLLASFAEIPTYLFQVQDRKAKITSISLSSADRPELQQLLERIYLSAEKGVDLRSSLVLKRLLS